MNRNKYVLEENGKNLKSLSFNRYNHICNNNIFY